MRKELTTVFDARKSFYGKAYVSEESNTFNLFSYDTYIATISNGHIKFASNIKDLLSQTTLRHLKEFMKQYLYRFDKQITKRDIIKMNTKH